VRCEAERRDRVVEGSDVVDVDPVVIVARQDRNVSPCGLPGKRRDLASFVDRQRFEHRGRHVARTRLGEGRAIGFDDLNLARA